MSRVIPLRVGQQVELCVEGISHEGEGVARHQGYTVFVPESLPGDRVMAEVISTRKQYGRALPLAVLQPSADRVDAPCPYYDRCGGCQLMHADYAAQLRYKTEQVASALSRIGGLCDPKVSPVMGMEEPWRYRNKGHLPVAEQNGQLIAGFYRRRSHDLVDISSCLIQESSNNRGFAAARAVAVEFGLTPYDEGTHRGMLRSILLRNSAAAGELMVVYVINGTRLPQSEQIGARLATLLPDMASFQYNINTQRGNTLLGSETVTVWGKDHIRDRLLGLDFKVSARSFYQVNSIQTARLYDTARLLANLQGGETVVDLYCGVGTIGLSLAARAARVVGIEVVPDAVADARENARINDIHNAVFICGTAEEAVPRLLSQGESFDVAVLDPPRAGCDESLLSTLVKAGPARIVYVSCNPATLARDVKHLCAHGYRFELAQPVDMFPHTSHAECVVALTKI